jgi:transcriptional regulator of NAD metabolism
VDAFVDKVEKHRTKPLNALTDGIHFHTIEADEEEILDRIVNQLREKGFLLG